MNIIEAIILGIVQGLTEFIPVSSSGHLVLLHDLLGAEKGGLGFDVALHIGTLGALVIFFWRDIIALLRRLFAGGKGAKLPLMLMAACVPAVIAGAVLQDAAETTFRSPRLVALNLAVFGLVMLLAEKYALNRKKITTTDDVSLKKSLIIGAFQALAIVPGVSRSGSTISGGLFMGLNRETAARFSFLLAIPITFGAMLKLAIDGSFSALGEDKFIVAVGIMFSLLSGLLAIRYLLKFVAKHSLAVFAYYRIALALLIIVLTI